MNTAEPEKPSVLESTRKKSLTKRKALNIILDMSLFAAGTGVLLVEGWRSKLLFLGGCLVVFVITLLALAHESKRK